MIANAASQDLPTLRASLFSELLQIADKPASQRSASESLALEWFATQVKANRIEEKQNALDLYHTWASDPWSYKTPQGFGIETYSTGAPRNAFQWLWTTPAAPDVREHGTALAHQEMITTEGVTAQATLSKTLACSLQNNADYQTLLNLGSQSGLTSQEMGAITMGSLTGAGIAGTAIAGATLTGTSLGAVGAAIFPYSLGAVYVGHTSFIVSGTAIINGNLVGVSAGAVSMSGGFAAAAAGGVTFVLLAAAYAAFEGVSLFGSDLFGVEGKVNLPTNLQNELNQAKNASLPDLKTLAQTSPSELYTAFLEATIGDNPSGQYGTAGNNTFTGTNGNDEYYGLAGNDTFNGLAGHDFADGGQGHDNLSGGEGNDILDGSDGNDFLFGDNGNDTLYGWTGNDYLSGDNGDDYLDGEVGNDTLTGGMGNDIIRGGEGKDIALYAGHYTEYQITLTASGVIQLKDTVTSNGNQGTDLIAGVEQINFSGGGVYGVVTGTTNNDTLTATPYWSLIFAGEGNDTLTGGNGHDTLSGGAGNDLLTGAGGNDLLTGGTGADQFIFNAVSEGIDTITDFHRTQGDKIQINQSFGATSSNQFSVDYSTDALFFNGQQFATLSGISSSSDFNVATDLVLA